VRARLVPLALVTALALIGAACGDDSGGGGTRPTTTAATTTTRTPQIGGTLTFAEYSEPAGLDPIVSTGAGVTGAIEMTAVYDTIMRWDPATGKYEPRTAESLSSNADFTEWTLKLKPGIKFTDGTDYDASAVVFGMNRHRSGLPGAPPCAEVVACPRNSTSSGVYMALVKSMEAVDKVTVRFTLSEPWSAFAYALSDEASMIPSPTALKKCDGAKDVRQCEFNLKPVGAGPFMVDSFKPKDSIRMARNPTYHGGPVYLDGLVFVNPGDAGGDKTYEQFKSGAVQAAFLRAPSAVAAAKADRVAGYSAMQHAGGIFLINGGISVACTGGNPAPICTGRPDGPTVTDPPTKNLKVRKAIAAAIDPRVINDRGNQGKGLPGSELLQSDFRWNPGVAGPKYDVDAAKKLIAEAKAEGWDGKVRLLYNNSPLATNIGLAAQTMLSAVGIDAVLDVTKDSTGQISQVVVQRDFDIAGWGMAISNDDGAMAALAQNFSSVSPSNRVGIKSATIDQALREIRQAATDDAKRAAFRKIAEVVANEVPVLVWAKIEEYIAWSPKVHGIVPNHSTSVFLDKAWIER
jgi:peptide/nickel transport system substrate-binding protein